jgi:integrase
MRRKGSQNRYYVRRIPSDVLPFAAGLKLAVPIGEHTQHVKISAKAQSLRLSLRTSDPIEVKLRQSRIDEYLDAVWSALRDDRPLPLSNKQAHSLASKLYRAWAEGEDQERATAVEYLPGVGWQKVAQPYLDPEEWQAAVDHAANLQHTEDLTALERAFGAIIDRLLISKGIRRVDAPSRELILRAFAQALREALETRTRNAAGDYSPDAKASRFPNWPSSKEAGRSAKMSLMGLMDGWWTEAKAVGRKPSTHESYRNTMAAFVAYLGHDDATRVTNLNIIGFKDHRLAAINPRTGRPASAKTVKDSDLSGLKTIFGWAKANAKISENPALGVTLKLGKQRRLRSKGFSDKEAMSILRATRKLKRGGERAETFAAKHWVPWLCAYTGARVGEIGQLRRQDFRKEGRLWVMTISPEAGTVKTDEARDVVLHSHLIEMGLMKFVLDSGPGHLFLRPSSSGDVLGPLQGLKNRLAEFVRGIVPDKNVAPNHGWRHRFKTVGIEAGIEHRVLDGIQGQSPRTASEGYGEVSLKAQAKAMARMPRYRL